MNNHIKFAGISLGWTEEYSISYADKLCEMGMYAKEVKISNLYLVAYSHKPFSRSEAIRAFQKILESD